MHLGCSSLQFLQCHGRRPEKKSDARLCLALALCWGKDEAGAIGAIWRARSGFKFTCLSAGVWVGALPVQYRCVYRAGPHPGAATGTLERPIDVEA